MKNIKYLIFLALIFTISCKEVFEKSLDKEKIILTAPVDSLLSTDSNQTFFWQPFDSGTRYEVQIVSPKFDSIIKLVIDTNILSNQFRFSLDSSIYQWRVRAFNSSSSTQFSLPRTLTIH